MVSSFQGYEKMMSKLNFKKNNLSDLQLTLAGADVNGDNHLEFSEWRNDLKKLVFDISLPRLILCECQLTFVRCGAERKIAIISP